MTLRATFEILNPMIVEMKLTAAMPLADWIRIRDALRDDPHYHSKKSEFAGAITSMVDQAQAAFIGEKEAK